MKSGTTLRAQIITLLSLFAMLLSAAPQAHAQATTPAYKEPSSAHFDITGTMGVRGGHTTYAFTGTGMLSGDRLMEVITQEVPPSLTEHPAGGPGQAVLSIVMAGSKGYVKVEGDVLSGKESTTIGTNDNWFLMDLRDSTHSALHSFPGFLPNTSTGPSPAFASALHARRTGKATLNGAPTTLYRLDVDLAKWYMAAYAYSSQEVATYSEFMDNNTRVTLYMWVGDTDNYVHQERIEIAGSERQGVLELTSTITYHDFNSPVTINEPANATPFNLQAGDDPNAYYPGAPSTAGLFPGYPLSFGLLPVNPFLAEQGSATPGMPHTGGNTPAENTLGLLPASLATLLVLTGLYLKQRQQAHSGK